MNFFVFLNGWVVLIVRVQSQSASLIPTDPACNSYVCSLLYFGAYMKEVDN